MAYLAPSLKRLFLEIDAVWPNRNHGIDGWLRWPSQGISAGHNPDSKGCVHAIDVDRRGIDPDWLCDAIYHSTNILWYVIWNRRIRSNTYNWTWRAYTGSNPHTDHVHIEIRHTSAGENYTGAWLGSVQKGMGGGDSTASSSSDGGAISKGFSIGDARDPTAMMLSIADGTGATATTLDGYSDAFDGLYM